jgi:hypothetical protein
VRKHTALVLMILAAALLMAQLPGGIAAEQPAADVLEMMQAYREVLAGSRSYVQLDEDSVSDRELFLESRIYHWAYFDFEKPLKVVSFCMADLDSDGYPEVILSLSEDFGFQLLRWENGIVYGFPFVYRAMEDITLEGDIHGSNGAYDTIWYRVRFSASRREDTEICRMQGDSAIMQYFISGAEVPEEDYRAFIDALMKKPRPSWLDFTPGNISAVIAGF